MNLEQRRIYSRGWNAGMRGRWPDHKPPMPPLKFIAAMMQAAQNLRDAVDGQCAMFDEDDPVSIELYKPVDELDEAMMRLSAWLKEVKPQSPEESGI